MASSLVVSVRPAGIRASGGDRRSDGRNRRNAGNWWTPLFGWPAVPDYIEAAAAGGGQENEEIGEERRIPVAGRRFAALTEEKARELRMKTVDMERFHDVMYHSAIASRLASDLPPRRSDR